MHYREALDYILAPADYERSPERLRYRDFNLARVRALLERLGNPDAAFGSVHIAGTKGKGSTSAMAASVLRAAGHRTGLYTSPHLHTMRERIAVDGSPVSEEEFARGVEAIQPAAAAVDALGTLGRVTTFELLTALAFYLFREQGVRYAVVEAGLGGRLDATNVIAPLACAITNISLDHTEVLGATVAEIAREKAAIIKPGVPVVSGPQPPEALAVIEEAARRQGGPLTLVGRDVLWNAGPADLEGQHLTIRTRSAVRTVRLPLLGAFQRENAATATGVCEALVACGVPIGERAMLEGLAQVRWPGRVEVLSRPASGGLAVVDGAHNPYSMARLAEALRETFSFRRVVAIVGVGRTKDLGGMLEALAALPVTVVAAQSRNPLALPARQVQDACAARGIPAEAAADTAHAVERARALAEAGDLILATGSLFIVAEVRETMLGIPPELYALGRAVV